MGLNAHNPKSVRLLTRCLIVEWVLLGMYVTGHVLSHTESSTTLVLMYAAVISYKLAGLFIALFTVIEWNALTRRCQRHCIIHHIVFVIVVVYRLHFEKLPL